MRSLGLLLLCIGVCLLGSCATIKRGGQSGAAGKPNQVEKIVPYPKDVTWSAILDLINERMWRAEDINEPNGHIRLAAFGFEGDQTNCDCRGSGGGPFEDHKARFEINIAHVTASGTKVSVDSRIDAYDRGARSSRRVACISTGMLEDGFIAAIDSVVTARQKLSE